MAVQVCQRSLKEYGIGGGDDGSGERGETGSEADYSTAADQERRWKE